MWAEWGISQWFLFSSWHSLALFQSQMFYYWLSLVVLHTVSILPVISFLFSCYLYAVCTLYSQFPPLETITGEMHSVESDLQSAELSDHFSFFIRVLPADEFHPQLLLGTKTCWSGSMTCSVQEGGRWANRKEDTSHKRLHTINYFIFFCILQFKTQGMNMHRFILKHTQNHTTNKTNQVLKSKE